MISKKPSTQTSQNTFYAANTTHALTRILKSIISFVAHNTMGTTTTYLNMMRTQFAGINTTDNENDDDDNTVNVQRENPPPFPRVVHGTFHSLNGNSRKCFFSTFLSPLLSGGGESNHGNRAFFRFMPFYILFSCCYNYTSSSSAPPLWLLLLLPSRRRFFFVREQFFLLTSFIQRIIREKKKKIKLSPLCRAWSKFII